MSTTCDGSRTSSTDQCRSWLWALNKFTGPVLEKEEYVTAVRAMLGCDFLDDEVVCEHCGGAILDLQARHALTCFGAKEVNRGHDRCRDTLAGAFVQADPSTRTEPKGLLPAEPERRPRMCCRGRGRRVSCGPMTSGLPRPRRVGTGRTALK